MTSYSYKYTDVSDFRRKSTFAVAIAALLILTPFAANNFLQGRFLLGIGSLAIVIILAFNAWYIRKGGYSSLYILIGLVPAILFFLLLAIYQQQIIGVLWCYPALLSFYMMLPERKAWIANAALLLVTVPFAWSVLSMPVAIRVTATMVAVSIFSALFVRIITKQQLQVHDQATHDPLTGLYNRMLLHTLIDQAIQQSRRTGTPMTLLTVDIDHFKSVNDKYGHDAGDVVLQSVSGQMKERVRSVDKVFRIGGEEFLVLLFGTDSPDSELVAEELRNAIASLRINSKISVTVSIGVAALEKDENWNSWIKRSDENLYRAKEAGRNRVIT